MRTNFQMVVDFQDYMPSMKGFTSKEEIERIVKHFGLAEMTMLELQNLRDFIVLWYRGNNEKFEAMLSLTAVIDSFKYQY